MCMRNDKGAHFVAINTEELTYAKSVVDVDGQKLLNDRFRTVVPDRQLRHLGRWKQN